MGEVRLRGKEGGMVGEMKAREGAKEAPKEIRENKKRRRTVDRRLLMG